MTPGLPLHFHSKLSSLSCASPHRKPYKKTVIKDHNREWAESGPLWGKLIYLYSVSAGLNTHCFSFSLTLHTIPPFRRHLSRSHPNEWWFFSTSMWHHICHRLPPRKSGKDSSARTKICRNNHFVFQLWPSVSSEPNSQTCRAAFSQGTVHRTIAHVTPDPSASDSPKTTAMSETPWIMKVVPVTRGNARVSFVFSLIRPQNMKTRLKNCLSCKQGQSA